MSHNLSKCLYHFLNYLKHPIDHNHLILELEKHPDYPSLLALSDVLSGFGFDNAAYKVNMSDLSNLSFPIIAYTTEKNSNFLVIKSVNKNNIIVTNERWKNKEVKLDKFQEIFTGIVLCISKTPSQIRREKTSERGYYYLTLSIIVALFLIFLFVTLINAPFFWFLTWQIFLLTCIKLTGTIISLLLINQSINSNSSITNKICIIGAKADCNAVLSSKAAKIFDGLAWSDIGFFYFGGTLAVMIFTGASPGIMQVLGIINFICMPYLFYSLYLQAYVIKRWCTLCCITQVLIWLECLPFFSYTHHSFKGVNFTGVAQIITYMLLPIVCWLLLKPILIKLNKSKELNRQLLKIKYNRQLFNNLLTTQLKHPLPDEEFSIVLGSNNPKHVIIIVSNPYCQPCSNAHLVLADWLKSREDLQLRILHVTNDKKSENPLKVARTMVALNEVLNRDEMQQALHAWHVQKKKNYINWSNVYADKINEIYFYKQDKQKIWCDMAKVEHTPSFFINGYALPKIYQIDDIKYLLD